MHHFIMIIRPAADNGVVMRRDITLFRAKIAVNGKTLVSAKVATEAALIKGSYSSFASGIALRSSAWSTTMTREGEPPSTTPNGFLLA
jgi:hypothetical protein